MTPALLAKVGAALYGPLWQSELARSLEVNVRTVQRWAGGRVPIPYDVRSELRQLIHERREDLNDLLPLLE